jgi:hypothetical protein
VPRSKRRGGRCPPLGAGCSRSRSRNRAHGDPEHLSAAPPTPGRGGGRGGRRSWDTIDFHETKAGHLVLIFETNERGEHVGFPLARLRAFDVDAYIFKRRAAGATDTTISMELVVLRTSLRLAIRAGLWRGRVDEVIPVAFSPGYEPRKRALTAEELSKLLAKLMADRAARVAFIVVTVRLLARDRARAARRRERGARDRLAPARSKTRFRTVPIVSPAQKSLLAYALEHAKGMGDALFQPWATSAATSPTRARTRRSSAARPTICGARSRAGRSRRACRSSPSPRRWDTRTRGCWSEVYDRQTPEQLAALMARAMRLPPPLTPALSPRCCGGRGRISGAGGP